MITHSPQKVGAASGTPARNPHRHCSAHQAVGDRRGTFGRSPGLVAPRGVVKRETDCRVQGDPGHPPDAGHVARAQHGDPAARGGPGLGIANVQLWNPQVARGGPVVPGDRRAAQRRGTPDQARPAVERDPGAAGPGPDRDRLTLDDTLMNQY